MHMASFLLTFNIVNNYDCYDIVRLLFILYLLINYFILKTTFWVKLNMYNLTVFWHWQLDDHAATCCNVV